MINIREVLQDLDNDPKRHQSDFLHVRLLDSSSHVEMFAATTPSIDRRYVLIKLKQKMSDKELFELPQWAGMTIEQQQLSIFDRTRAWYLLLSNQIREDREIFELFMQNFCNEMLQVQKETEFRRSLLSTLQRWKDFFTSHGKHGLSDSQQRGLFGELWFLKQVLEKIGDTTIVNSWTGAQKTTHDFMYNSFGVEVKTSSAKKHHKFTVANETQLDDTGYKALYLLFLSVGEMTGSGHRLPQIIEELRTLLGQDLVALGYLNERLFDAGYLDDHAILYSNGYVIREVKSFHVRDGFPRVLSPDLPEGVGDLSYSVQVSACEPYKTTFDRITQDLTGR